MAPSSGQRKAHKRQGEMEERKIVGIEKEIVTNVVSTDYPDNYINEDHAWDVDYFASQFRVEFHQNDDYDAQFSLIGLDASIANAFRRILIAEIPTLAIEKVFMNNNTSVIQDEVLAHRLGLIPFTGGKEGLRKMTCWEKPDKGEQPTFMDLDTVSLSLEVACTKNENATPGEKDPTKLYHNAHVYAKDIVFKAQGAQEKWFAGEDAIRPVNPDILIAKLRPPQVLDIEMFMHKGIGADHAKFSPVCTASYRLMPTITITKPVLGTDAKKFAECFMRGTIGIQKVTREEARTPGSGYEGHEGEDKAVVVNPMFDTVSREVLRHKEFEGKVKLGRKRDHFIFSVESTGQWESDELFMEAVSVMKQKVQKMRKQVIEMAR